MKNFLCLFALLVLVSCGTAPEPIAYGHDTCDFCSMTIVNDSYAAQSVSLKGKQYKYDSIECMVNALQETGEEMAVWQVSDYLSPGRMLSVDQVNFVIHDSLKSPMGGNLAALDKAKAVSGSMGWEALKLHFKAFKSDHGGH